MNWILLFSVLQHYFVLCFAQDTLWTLIESNSNTTTFAGYIQDAQMTTVFQNPGCTGTADDCITLFAPSNSAVEAAATQLNWGQMNVAQKNLFVSRHIFRYSQPLRTSNWNSLGQPLNLIDIGFGTGRVYNQMYATQRYMFQSAPIPQYGPNNLYFVGNALVVQPDLEASNGIMHVLDNVQLTPEADNYFISYLTKQSDLTTSAELWTSLGSDPKYMAILNQQWNRKEIYSTFFIVTNDGWSKVPNEQMTLLRSNMSLLVSVLANHYMPNQLLYSEWTPVQYTINFFTGFPSDPTGTDISQLSRGAMRRLLNGTVVVTLGGSDAAVQGSSTQLKQAVLHRIPAPLGFIYETREQVLTRLNSQLLTACQADTTCNTLLTSETQLTVFSPNTNLMTNFGQLTNEQKTTLLKYMFLPGKLVRGQMTDLKTIAVGNMTDAIRFRVDGQILYYDARLANHGYVASQVTVWDEMATNGVIHTINGLPGIPTEKIEDYIARNGQFSKFSAYQFVQNLTLGAPYTFCAPTNTALLAMEASTTVGLVLLQNQTRREYIFRRHTFPMQLLLEDLQLKSYDTATANYAFTREEVRLTVSSASNNKRVGTLTFQGQTTEISTSTGSLEFTNGWLYTVDKLMYTSADLTGSMCNQRGCP